MARFLSFINQLLNFIVEHFRFRLSEYAQDTIKALNRIEYFSLIVFTYGPAGQGGVHFASKIVDGRQRTEVFRSSSPAPNSWCFASRHPATPVSVRASTRAKVAQL